MTVEKLLPQIKRNVLLKDYTTFKIGGRAKYFFEARTKEDLIGAVKLAKENRLPFFILGGGSNLLVFDKGYNGLIIKVKSQKIKLGEARRDERQEGSSYLPSKVKSKNQKSKILEVDSGVLLSQIVNLAFQNNLRGLEWMAGIPGTVGGAIYGNAGAFKKSMKDVVKEVEVFDVKTEKVKILKNKDCKFGYRDSIFKRNKNLIILSAKIQLKKENKKKIENRIKENLEYKKKTQPLNFSSAGSIFKNPQGLSAGELIEKCDLKGKRIGNVKISEKHANFIVNLGEGKARDVKKLINLIKKRVKERFGIKLEEEIQYLGFKN